MTAEPTPTEAAARDHLIPLIGRIIDACPRRLAGSGSEREAQHMLRAEFDALGWRTALRPFEWNESLYAVLALHFGLATLGTALFFLSPLLALALHALAGVSYFADSHRRGFLLRRWFEPVQSQTLLATRPTVGDRPRLRVVLVAHADAAFTGVVFDPRLIRLATRPPPIAALRYLSKGLGVATFATLALAALDLVAIFGATAPAWIVLPLTIPAALAFGFNLQVVLRDEVVPGANDNLTGCVGALHLAERLADLPEDVEIVAVATGAEEAGTGGAFRLSKQVADEWSPTDTVVIGIDGLAGGQPRWFCEGEVLPERAPAWLLAACADTAKEPGFEGIEAFEIPSGATDGLPFLVAGYDAITIGCVEPTIGAPREYHRPTDTADRLDPAEYARSLDYVEALVRRVVATRA